jgi:hypothetical protein
MSSGDLALRPLRSDCTRPSSPDLCSLTGLEAVFGRRGSSSKGGDCQTFREVSLTRRPFTSARKAQPTNSRAAIHLGGRVGSLPSLRLISLVYRLKRDCARSHAEIQMIRKLKSGQYRLCSRKKDPKTGRRRNLRTFNTRRSAQAGERAVQYFKRQG